MRAIAPRGGKKTSMQGETKGRVIERAGEITSEMCMNWCRRREVISIENRECKIVGTGTELTKNKRSAM